MPLIPFKGDDLDGVRLTGVMCFPDDEARRRHWFAHHKALREASRLDTGSNVDVTVAELRDILGAPENDVLKASAKAAAKHGYAVGGVLMTMYVMDRFSLPEPSLRKARPAWASFAETAKWTDGEPMEISDRHLRNIWDRFEPVAHLWAAKAVNLEYPYTDNMRSPEGRAAMLEVAAGILRWAESFVPFRARPPHPVVDGNRAWRGPSDVLPRDLYSERRPEKLLKFLKKYRAPEYKL